MHQIEESKISAECFPALLKNPQSAGIRQCNQQDLGLSRDVLSVKSFAYVLWTPV